VRALVRPDAMGKMGKLPMGAAAVVGDALDAASFAARIAPADTLFRRVGTPHLRWCKRPGTPPRRSSA